MWRRRCAGRELFGDSTAHALIAQGRAKSLSDNDIVATITRITAASILLAYEQFVPESAKPIHEIYFCGGGSFNPNMYVCPKSPIPNPSPPSDSIL